jgi:hypothetical protein
MSATSSSSRLLVDHRLPSRSRAGQHTTKELVMHLVSITTAAVAAR